MAKRSMHEIEKDYKRIRALVDSTPLTSIKDIAQATNLSECAVKISLSKHPLVEKKIMEQLNKNKEELQAKKKAEQEALEAKKRAEQEALEAKKRAEEEALKAKKKAEQEALEAKKKAEQEALKAKKGAEHWTLEPRKKAEPEVKQNGEANNFESGFVIDASIAGIESLEDTLSKICATNAKIILTSVTIKELGKMQKFNDHDAFGARHIMAMAAENPESFFSVLIDETIGIPDDCIIEYCNENKGNVTLLTSDKEMALKARMYGVQTQYFKRTVDNASSRDSKYALYSKPRVETLRIARKVGRKLIISDFNSNNRSVLVISNSNGCEYTDGMYELKIGDDVFIALKYLDYLTFSHFQITSLSAENNCKLLYSQRIYSTTKLKDLPRENYRDFICDFKRRYYL